MRSLYNAIFLAILLVALSAATALAQNEPADEIYLPLVIGPRQATSAVFNDSTINPAGPSEPEQIVPYSLRDVTASTTNIEVDVRLAPLDIGPLLEEDRKVGKEQHARRIGVVRALPDVVSAGTSPQSGRWGYTPDGGRYWLLTIESPDAEALRIHLEDLSIPPGGHVLVYNTLAPEEVYGPYRQRDLYGQSELWTTSVFGAIVSLEYYLPPGAAADEIAPLRVTEISHMYVDPLSLLSPAEGSCHNDVTCYSSWDIQAYGVAGLGTINGGVALWCTGTLLNDFDAETFAGYFLTANHCLSGSSYVLGTQANANAIEYYWLYQTLTCNGTVPNLATVPRTATGADLLSRSIAFPGNDHAFMRIRGGLPGGVWLLGWAASALNYGESAIGVHHPSGAYKRISFGSVSNFDSDYWDVGWWSGVTEPGSSGSPIFDEDGRLRGQLWGGSSSCSNPTGLDYYGRFDVTYPNISHWMEMGGTVNVNRSYVGTERGTPSQPFNTVGEANAFAWNGSRIKITSGTYAENVTFTKELTIVTDGGTVTIGN